MEGRGAERVGPCVCEVEGNVVARWDGDEQVCHCVESGVDVGATPNLSRTY